MRREQHCLPLTHTNGSFFKEYRDPKMIKWSKKWLKWFTLLVTIFLVLFVIFAVYTNVSTNVTVEDVDTFLEIGLMKPNKSLTFEQQISLIRQVQHAVFKRAPVGRGIPDYEPREPADLIKFGQGLCYDRSRTFDKALNYLGFESRHVFILYREDKLFLKAFFRDGQTSHAVTEVKTNKGWMLVDSNTEWVALTSHGEPVNADEVWHRFREFSNAPEYLNKPWWAIRGMYSRKGQLFSPFFLFPDFNWFDFFGWLIGFD